MPSSSGLLNELAIIAVLFLVLFTYHWRVMYIAFIPSSSLAETRIELMIMPLKLLVMTFIVMYFLLCFYVGITWILHRQFDYTILTWPLHLKFIIPVTFVLLYMVLIAYLYIRSLAGKARDFVAYPKNTTFSITLLSIWVGLGTFVGMAILQARVGQ